MEKLEFRALETRAEAELSIEKFQTATGVRLPLNYVEGSKNIGVFLHNKLVAGYMIVTKPGYRSLMFVPDQIKKSNKFFSENQNDMLEVNGLWIGPSLKSPQQQFRVWFHMAMNVITSRKKFVLLMSNSKNRNIQYLHGLIKSTPLYEGSPNLMAGDESHAVIKVGYTTTWNCFSCIPKYWVALVKNRQRRLRVASKQRQLARA